MPRRPVVPRLAVGAVIIEGDRVLLIQRAKPPRQGHWSIPGGGVEPGELLQQAVIREAREETGLIIQPGPLVCIYEWIERARSGPVTHHHVVCDYLCTVTGGTLRAAEDAADARYVTFKEAAGLDVTDGLMTLLVRAFTLARRGAATEAVPVSARGSARTPRRTRR